MSFSIKQINLIFEDKPKQLPPLELKGLKCNVVAESIVSRNSFSTCQVRVWGMTLEQMLQFSSIQPRSTVISEGKSIKVLVGEQGKSLTEVFNGSIFSSYIDTSSLPDVSLVCSGLASYSENAAPIAPNSYKGTQKAEAVIESLTKQLGSDWTFKNNGASAVIENQYLYGSAVQQIREVARLAKFSYKLENNTVTIWPSTGFSSNDIVEIGPTTGMIGYPSFTPVGLMVRSEFKPIIGSGRLVRLTSDLPNAKGDFLCLKVNHELSTVTSNGPWFSNMDLVPLNNQNVPKN